MPKVYIPSDQGEDSLYIVNDSAVPARRQPLITNAAVLERERDPVKIAELETFLGHTLDLGARVGQFVVMRTKTAAEVYQVATPNQKLSLLWLPSKPSVRPLVQARIPRNTLLAVMTARFVMPAFARLVDGGANEGGEVYTTQWLIPDTPNDRRRRAPAWQMSSINS